MDKKYWVPALEKADAVLEAVAAEPGKLKQIELSRRLGIHKSTMFSLLHTMELLGWLRRERGDTYSAGVKLVRLGSSALRQNSLVERFQREAPQTVGRIGETLQLGRMDGRDVFYLAKEEAPTPVRLVSEPGMRFPAHQTALGKAMLADMDDAAVAALYPEPELPAATPYSIRTAQGLLTQLPRIRAVGVAFDEQESVVGFRCVAAPIWNEDGRATAAVSCSMPLHQWESKHAYAIAEIKRLAAELSVGRPREEKVSHEAQ